MTDEVVEVIDASAPVAHPPVIGVNRSVPPFSVTTFMRHADFKDFLDAKRFARMRYVDSETREVTEGREKYMTAVQAWENRFIHWGGRGYEAFFCTRLFLDGPYIRCSEESVYARQLAELCLRRFERHDFESNASLDLVLYPHPFDRCWFAHEGASQADHWDNDLDTEWRIRRDYRRFAGWHQVEIWALSRRLRNEHYVAVPAWWDDYEPSRIINAPSPAVFSYLSNFIVTPRQQTIDGVGQDSETVRHFNDGVHKTIMAIALSEFVVSAFIRFLIAASEGVTNSKCLDPRLRVARNAREDPGGRSANRPTGILTPLPESLHRLIESFGIFEMVAGSRFDAGRSLLAFSRAVYEVRWDRLPETLHEGGVFLWYNFETGEVLDIPPVAERQHTKDQEPFRLSGVVAESVMVEESERSSLAECIAEATDFFRDRRMGRGRQKRRFGSSVASARSSEPTPSPHQSPPRPVVPPASAITPVRIPRAVPPPSRPGTPIPGAPADSLLVGGSSGAPASVGYSGIGGAFRPVGETIEPKVDLADVQAACNRHGLQPPSSMAELVYQLPALVAAAGSFFASKKTAAAEQSKLAALTAERNDLCRQLTAAQAHSSTLAIQVQETQGLQDELVALRAERVEAENAKAVVRSTKETAAAVVAAAEEKVKTLEAQVVGLTQERDAQAQQVVALRASVGRLKADQAGRANDSREIAARLSQAVNNVKLHSDSLVNLFRDGGEGEC